MLNFIAPDFIVANLIFPNFVATDVIALNMKLKAIVVAQAAALAIGDRELSNGQVGPRYLLGVQELLLYFGLG
jgi:hypothetical protein